VNLSPARSHEQGFFFGILLPEAVANSEMLFRGRDRPARRSLGHSGKKCAADHLANGAFLTRSGFLVDQA
jgi:hypothetical protein